MVSHTFWSDFEFDWLQKATRDRFEKCRLPYLHIMLIMPVVKGEAFNACWLDKSSSLQPNLNTRGGEGLAWQSSAGGSRGRCIFRSPNIQICRSWVKSFSPRENKFSQAEFKWGTENRMICCTFLWDLNNVTSHLLCFVTCCLLFQFALNFRPGPVCPIPRLLGEICNWTTATSISKVDKCKIKGINLFN